MKLSTRSRYGLRLMFELALYYNKGSVILKDIAERQQISAKYLSKLVIPLHGAGLVFSTRGMKGGYTLSRPPAAITVMEIIELLEGGLTLVECTRRSDLCTLSVYCPTRTLWCKLETAIRKVFSENTLQTLLDEYQDARQAGALSFQI